MDKIFGSWWPWGRQEGTITTTSTTTATETATTTYDHKIINLTTIDDIFWNTTDISFFVTKNLTIFNNLTDEEDIFYKNIWNCTTFNLNCSINPTNLTNVETQEETTLQFLITALTAIVLGIIILTTVIGKWNYFIIFQSIIFQVVGLYRT